MCQSARLKAMKLEPSDQVTEMQVVRQREPEHFLVKVEHFSESSMEKYEFDEFDAGGYKWRLILYPNGDKKRNGSNHLSLYLSICNTQNLPPSWEVEIDFSLFLYNSISEKYLSYTCKTLFNWLKKESGFAQLMPLDEFKEVSNGYLFGDACVFGAQVYVSKSIPRMQTSSMMKDKDTDTNSNVFTWRVGNFSSLNEPWLQSKNFVMGDVQWNLRLYPKGIKECKDRSISFFLGVADDSLTKLTEKWTVNAEYKLRIRNQLNTNHYEKSSMITHMFTKSSAMWGYSDFMAITDAHNESKGFLKNHCLVAEVEFGKVEIIKNFK